MISLLTRSLLVVEDNPDDESLTLRALRRSDVDNPIVIVRDGEEAIRLLADPSAQELALVLLDLKLPKRNGFEVIRHLRLQAHTRLVPVVVLTSSDEESDVRSCYDNGANAYVSKPVDFQGYMDVMDAIAGFWLRHNQPPNRY